MNANSEECLRELKETFEDAIEGEPRTELFFGELEAFFAQAFGPEGDIPVGEWSGVSCGLSECSEFFQFFFGGFQCRQQEFVEHLLNGSGVSRHFAGEAEIGEAIESEQLGLFFAEFQDPRDQGGIIEFTG